MKKLHARPEYKHLTPRPNPDDYNAMLKDIKEHGQKLRITANQDRIILDGYTRLDICEKLGLKVKYDIRTFKDRAEEIAFIISMNSKRRHLRLFQRVEMGEAVLKEEKIKAQERMKKGTLSSPDLRGTATKIAAKAAGISQSTLERGLFVKEHATTAMKKKLESDKIAVKTAYSILTREKRSLPKKPIPRGEWDVIYADPALQFENRSIRGSSDNNYETMTTENIARLKIPTAASAILFLWMPTSLIWDGTASIILRGWNFEPVTSFAWIKDRIGTGSYTRNQHEHLIIAFKGKRITPAKLFSSVIYAPRGQHSAKPEKIYSMIEQMYPKRKYLELFARKKHKGWTSWGNELVENLQKSGTPITIEYKFRTWKWKNKILGDAEHKPKGTGGVHVGGGSYTPGRELEYIDSDMDYMKKAYPNRPIIAKVRVRTRLYSLDEFKAMQRKK